MLRYPGHSTNGAFRLRAFVSVLALPFRYSSLCCVAAGRFRLEDSSRDLPATRLLALFISASPVAIRCPGPLGRETLRSVRSGALPITYEFATGLAAKETRRSKSAAARQLIDGKEGFSQPAAMQAGRRRRKGRPRRLPLRQPKNGLTDNLQGRHPWEDDARRFPGAGARSRVTA